MHNAKSNSKDDYAGGYDPRGNEARKHRERYQTGSDALYFARCAEENETWLPILEKAFAKVHGDYDSISGGWMGEAVEDMTGGVTTGLNTWNILDKDRLWKELVNEKQEFLFAVATRAARSGYEHWLKTGMALQHAYSVLKAVEADDEKGKKHRLVKIRNPWGKRSWQGTGEWDGPWSDGSEEW